MKEKQTEEKILEMAMEVFLDRGYDGARTKEIAERAGINKALLHYYFRSKEKLYRHAFRRLFHRFLHRVLSRAGDSDDIFAYLSRFMQGYMDVMYREPRIVPFILWELHGNGGLIEEMIRQELHEQGDQEIPLLRAIRLAQQRGEIGPGDPVQITISVLALVIFPLVGKPLLERMVPGLQVDSPAFREQRLEFLTAFVRRGLQPEEA